jgi:hypothetical protein
LPAKPKKIEREKGDEPSVIVLLVDRPFAAEFSTEDKPEKSQQNERRDRAGGPVQDGRALSRPGVMPPLDDKSLHERTSYQI